MNIHLQSTPYALPLALVAAISAVLTIGAWRRREVRAAIPFGLLALALFEWCVGYALELSSADLWVQEFWAKTEYFGIVTAPLAWAIFAATYTGREQWLNPRRLVLLSILPGTTLLLVWTNDWHGLIWSHVVERLVGSYATMSPSYGAWFWLHTAYSYTLMLIGTLLILQTVIRSPGLYRGQGLVLVVGALAPWIGNAFYLTRASPFPYLDLTPFSFAVTGLALAWDMAHFRLLNIVPIARELVIESMPDVVFVLDARDRVVDLNPAARQVLGRSASEVVGSPVREALAAWRDVVDRYVGASEAHDELMLGDGAARRWFDLRISPLRDRNGRLTGRLVVGHDVTERVRAEKARAAAYRISEAAHSARTLDELFGSIHSIVGELMPASSFYIALYDAASDALTFPYWSDERDPVPGPTRPDEGLTGYVLRHGEPLLASPAVFQEMVKNRQVEEVGAPSVDWLGVPLKTNGQTTGVLAVQSYDGVVRFGEPEREILGFVAEQLSMAVERVRAEEAVRRAQDELEIRVTERTADLAQANASLQEVARENQRLFDELERSLAMSTRLHKLSSQILSASSVEETARLVTETLRESFSADAASTLIINAEQEVEYDYASGLSAGFSRDRKLRPQGMSLTAWRSGTPVIANTPEKIHPSLRAEGVQSTIALPLLGEPANHGVLFLHFRDRHTFSEREVELLSLFGNQAALSLKRVRLVEELRVRAVEQSTLGEVARALNAALDVGKAFPSVVDSLRRFTHCDHASIALLDKDNQEYTVAVLDEPRMEWKIGDRVAATASNTTPNVLAGRAYSSQDLSGELELPLEQTLYLAGVRSRVVLPLIVGARVLGVLNLASAHPHTFAESQLPLLQRIANSVAISVENTQLFEAEQTRRAELSALYGLSRALASAPLDTDSILSLVARHAVDTIHVTVTRVLLVESDELAVRAAYPRRVLGRDLAVGHRAALSDYALCRRVMEQNDPKVVRASDRTIADQEKQDLFLGICQTVCVVPLHADNRSLGLIVLGEERSEEREPFTAEKIRLARSIGDQAASALHRAELFRELEQSYLQTVLTLANAVEAKDSYTGDHIQNVARMAREVGREMGLTAGELEALRFGAILHDIGKIGIPDSILKKPGALNEEEWKIMRQHPVIGERIISPIKHLRDASLLVRYHHERFDGKGYPDGLAGEAIPRGARILSVVDSFSAIIDRRVYKRGRTRAEAAAELGRCAGTQFDPQVVQVFLRQLAVQAETQREPQLVTPI